MKIERLRIVNFRSIREFDVDGLGGLVVLVGPNGCGKTSVLDALRLLKSAYGGYQGDELPTWFTEMQIDQASPASVAKLFRDRNVPLRIEAELSISPDERAFLSSNADRLLRPQAWSRIISLPVDQGALVQLQNSPMFRDKRGDATKVLKKLRLEYDKAIAGEDRLNLGIEIQPGATEVDVTENPVARVHFSTYEPQSLGLFDYYAATRTYNREPLQQINMSAREFVHNKRQNLLYNHPAKFQNVKAELVANYIRELIPAADGSEATERLDATLQSLFSAFFPGKRYVGVRTEADGSLSFPVELQDGSSHDLDDMSSGEKEVIFGYLRLRNSTPRNSTIMFDEPELHLHPSLLAGFTEFYGQHVGRARNNQLWLTTHSSELMRQAVRDPTNSVIHMHPASRGAGNQAVTLRGKEDADRAVMALVGDLTNYLPDAPLLLVEGREDGTDVDILQRLVPDSRVLLNVVGRGARTQVRRLHDYLDQAPGGVIVPPTASVVDADSDGGQADPSRNRFSWSVYHVENFLLVPSYIAAAASRIDNSNRHTEDQVHQMLVAVAGGLVETLVEHDVRGFANKRLREAARFSPASDDTAIVDRVQSALTSAATSVADVAAELTHGALQQFANQRRSAYQDALSTENWMRIFPGRDLLKGLVTLMPNVTYAHLCEVVLELMVADGYAPEEMREIVRQVSALRG